MKNLLFTLPILLTLGCSANFTSTPSRTLHTETIDNLKFSFEVHREPNKIDSSRVSVDVELTNTSNDTMYFFTYTCDNWIGFPILEDNIAPAFEIHCNVTRPIVVNILPGTSVKHRFSFASRNKKIADEFSFGSTFYPVEKDFDLSSENTKHYKKPERKLNSIRLSDY